jgi:hypothetical protein
MVTLVPDNPFPVSTCQFAALEPSWAGIHSEAHLRGLLILGALFNRIIYTHDTQLLDNPHLLHAYQIRKDKIHSLYNHVATLIDNNVLRVAVRDTTYLPASDRQIPCDTLADVYNSWLIQDMKDAWVTPADKDREAYITDLEHLVNNKNFIRYPYMDIKGDFMKRTRESLYAGERSPHFHNYQSLPNSVRQRYDSLISRDWFSHSDVFDLLTKSKLQLEHPFVQAHGLFDEAAYASWNQSRLLGCDSKSWSAERAFTAKVEVPEPYRANFHVKLEDYAARTIDSDGISLLSTLKPEELIELRTYGEEMFNLTDFLNESISLQNISELQENYLNSVSKYWDTICRYLRKSRAPLTQEPTKIGIFIGDQFPNTAKLIGNVASFSVNLGIDLLGLPFPIIRNLDDISREELVNKLSFRFVFYSDNRALKNLRKAMPDRNWLAREMLSWEQK